MRNATLSQWLAREKVILTEAGVNERLRRDPKIQMHPRLSNAPLLLSREGREAMAQIYVEYLQIAAMAHLPIIMEAPCWRVNRPAAAAAGHDMEELHRLAVDFLREQIAGVPGARALVAGLMSPAGDAYRPEEALSEEEAFEFHAPTAASLAAAGADFLMPATLPSVREAAGIARAAALSGAEYVIAFVTDDRGRVLDGTSLWDAVSRVRAAAPRPPVAFMAACVHPGRLLEGLALAGRVPELLGLQGNASRLSPAELDQKCETDPGDPEDFAAQMLRLHLEYGFRILGGCCGTDGRHLSALVRLLA